jgi:3-methylcrotonyl-CoA carboxylase alpha subunit
VIALHEVIVAYEADGWRLTLAGESVLARGRFLDSGQFAGQLAVELDDRRLVASVDRGHREAGAETPRLSQWHELRHSARRSAAPRRSRRCAWRRPDRTDAGQGHRLAGAAGQQVEKGAPLLILEAMKMEHTITAPKNGRVKAFCYAAGDQVADGAELVDFRRTQ